MLTTSNTQYNSQRLKTVAAVQTFKKQYSFKACIAAVADPGEGPGGGAGPPLCFDHNETRRTEKKKFWTPPPPPFTAAMADPGEGPGGPPPPCFSTPSSQGLMTTLLPPPLL